MSVLVSDFVVDDVAEEAFPMLDELHKEHDYELTSADYIDAIIELGVVEFIAIRVYGAWLLQKEYVSR